MSWVFNLLVSLIVSFTMLVSQPLYFVVSAQHQAPAPPSVLAFPDATGIGISPEIPALSLFYPVGVAITDTTFPAATGGTPPYTYAIDGVPSGLEFDATNRVLSGIPVASTAGFSVDYTVTDSATPTPATVPLATTFNICPTGGVAAGNTLCPRADYTALALTSPANQTYTANQQITELTLPVATGGTTGETVERPTEIYSITPIPAGLSFDASSRVLSGTPTAVATTEISYKVRDAGSPDSVARSATATFTITVDTLSAPVPPTFERTPPTTFYVVENQKVVSAVGAFLTTATGDTINYSTIGADGTLFEVDESGTLIFKVAPNFETPRGGTQNTNTYTTTVIATSTTSGLTVESASVTITVTDIDEPPSAFTITSGTVTATTIVVNWDEATTDGAPPVNFYDIRVELGGTVVKNPSVEVDDRSITISGLTPNTEYTIDVNAISDEGSTASNTLIVTTSPQFDQALAFAVGTSIPDQTYTVDQPIVDLQFPRATGGNAPLIYTLAPAIPGLTLNPTTLTLEGTPTIARTEAIYTYTASDANSDSILLTFHIAINDLTPINYAPQMDSSPMTGYELTITPATVTESTESTNITLTVSLIDVTFSEALTFQINSEVNPQADGTATANTDYTPVEPTILTIPASAASGSVDIPFTAHVDTIEEPSGETVLFNAIFLFPSGLLSGFDTNSLTINDYAPVVVNAGPDQRVEYDDTIMLAGDVTTTTHTNTTIKWSHNPATTLAALTTAGVTTTNAEAEILRLNTALAAITGQSGTLTAPFIDLGLTSPVDITFTLTATDNDASAGQIGVVTDDVIITVEPSNMVPTIESITAATTVTNPNTLPLSVLASDPDSSSLTYTWSVPLNSGSFSGDGTGSSITYIPPSVETPRTIKLTVTVSDGIDRTIGTHDVVVSPVTGSSAPAFPDNVSVINRIYKKGVSITPINLPEATGGDGTIIYTFHTTRSLILDGRDIGGKGTAQEPPLGLIYNAATRTITGTPIKAFVEETFTFRAVDSDQNTGTEDSAEFLIKIAVRLPDVSNPSTYIPTTPQLVGISNTGSNSNTESLFSVVHHDGTSSLRIHWTPPPLQPEGAPELLGYKAYWYKTADYPASLMNSGLIDPTLGIYSARGLESVEHVLTVVAVNSNGESPYPLPLNEAVTEPCPVGQCPPYNRTGNVRHSLFFSIPPPAGVGNGVNNLQAVSNEVGRILLTWEKPDIFSIPDSERNFNFHGFKIYRGMEDEFLMGTGLICTDIVDILDSCLKHNLSGLEEGGKYSVSVGALRNLKVSDSNNLDETRAYITDIQVLAGVDIADASADEGEVVTFEVSIGGELEVPVTVDWAVTEGSPTDADSEPSGTATIPAGDTSTTFNVATSNNFVYEPTNETFTVTITEPSTGLAQGAKIRTSTAVGTIIDDDVRGITLTQHTIVLPREGETAIYTVVLDSEPTAPVTVTPTINDTAVATVVGTPLVFTASNWNEPQSVTVTGVGDGDTTISHVATGGDYGGTTSVVDVTTGVRVVGARYTQSVFTDYGTPPLASTLKSLPSIEGYRGVDLSVSQPLGKGGIALTLNPTYPNSINDYSLKMHIFLKHGDTISQSTVLEINGQYSTADEAQVVFGTTGYASGSYTIEVISRYILKTSGEALQGSDSISTQTFVYSGEPDTDPSFVAGVTIPDNVYTKGAAISKVSLPVVIGGNGVINYTLSPTLPDGLLFTDGIIPAITGNPIVSNPTTDYTYTATDSDGDTAILNFSIAINESPSFVNGGSFANIPVVENVDIVGTDNFFCCNW